MVKNKKILDGYKALCYIDNNTLLISRVNLLYSFNVTNDNITFLGKLELGMFSNILSKSSVINRLLRYEFRNALYLNESFIYLVFKNTFYKLSLKNFKIELLSNIDRGLNYSFVNKSEIISAGFYFGSYKENLRRDKKISIFRLWEDECIKVFDFPMNQIEHVHSVIPDPIRNIFWILTGDFGDAAGIWISDPEFKDVKSILRGDQNYRSCVGFPLSQGLLYATDSQMKQNSIYILSEEKPGEYSISKITDLNGPCIYGTQVGDSYYFSCSVEPYVGNSKSQIYRGLIGSRRASVISNPYVEIVRVDKDLSTTVIYKNRKDCLPFLFQFGSIMFPSNTLNDDLLVFYNMATYFNNMSTEIWNI